MYVFSETFGGVLVNAGGGEETLKGGGAASADTEIVPLGLVFSKPKKRAITPANFIAAATAAALPISDKKMSTFYKKITHKRLRRHTEK